MNVELARKVKAAILAEPASANMQCWMRFGVRRGEIQTSKNFCGTVGCVAGHIMIQAGLRKKVLEYLVNGADVESVASALLGVPLQEGKLLFYFYNGLSEPRDHPYHNVYEKLRDVKIGTLKYAKVIAEAIDLCATRNGVAL